MPIARNERVYPLSIKAPAQYAMNAGIVAAYDYAGDPANSYAGGSGVPHVGAKTLGLANGTPTVVEVSPGILGRDPSIGKTVTSYYSGTTIGALGFGSVDGKGAFTIHRRYRTPASFTGTTSARHILGYKDAASTTRVNLYLIETAGYCFFKWGLMGDSVYVPSNSQAGATASRQKPYNTLVDLHLVRDGDSVSVYINGVHEVTTQVPTLVTYNTDWAGSPPNDGPSSGTPLDVILVDSTIWNRALSDAEVSQHTSDPYAGYANTASVPDGLDVTNPAQGTTVNSEGFQVGGTYSGATVPTGFEYRFNGGAWAALTGVTIAGGNFSGTTGFVTAATGSLEVRFTNATGVTDTVTLITAQAPAPTVAITSQPPPDGQSQTFVLATTRANSVSVTLQANGNGAVTQGPVTAPVSDNAATVTITGIPPGDYTTSISATGSGGTVTIPGDPITILGVSGGGDPDETPPTAATAGTMAGPTSGTAGLASTSFTIGANGTIAGTVTFTPSDAANGGTFTPASVAIAADTPTAAFTYTPATAGIKTISVTNDGALTNPASITFTAYPADVGGPGQGGIIAWLRRRRRR